MQIGIMPRGMRPERNRVPMYDFAVHAGISNMGLYLAQIFAAGFPVDPAIRDGLRKGAMCLGKHDTMACNGASTVDEIRMWIEAGRQAYRIIAPYIAKRVHQKVRHPGANPPREAGPFGICQRMKVG
ncbi:hypothetical protein ACM41_21940 [Bradyrhizobium sp. CCBAU 21362]|nr:hypothetical protein [Bradyrhizobium sp. CCBAU 21362]